RSADDDRLARGDLPLDLRDDLPEPRRREAPGDRRPRLEDRAIGGQAERRADPPLQADPRADQGGPCPVGAERRQVDGGQWAKSSALPVVDCGIQPPPCERAAARAAASACSLPSSPT